MTNVIMLRGVFGKVGKTYFIQPCPNPSTGRYPDCVKTVDSKGDMTLSEKEKEEVASGLKHFIKADEVFTVTDGTSFDLSRVVDKAKWDSIEHCRWIAKDRFEKDSEGHLVIDGGAIRYGIAELYVERPGEYTKAKVSKKQLIHKACTYIFEDSESGRIKKCKVLGRDIPNAHPSDVTDYLIDKAEKTPTEIIKLYEGEEWKMKIFVLDAIERHVISKSDGIYKYNDKFMGGSIESTVLFLRDLTNRKITESIRIETYPELLPKDQKEAAQRELDESLLNTPELPKLAKGNSRK